MDQHVLEDLFCCETLNVLLFDTSLTCIRAGKRLPEGVVGKTLEQMAEAAGYPAEIDVVREVIATGVPQMGRSVGDVGLRVDYLPFESDGERGVLILAAFPLPDPARDGTISSAFLSRLRFERLLSALSESLVEARAETVDQVIEDALREIATTLGFDQTLMMKVDAARERLVLTHEWRSAEMVTVREGLLGLTVSELAYPVDKLEAGKTIAIVRDELPEGSQRRAALDQHGVDLVVIVPLSAGKTVLGQIAFYRRQSRPLSEHVLRRLELVGRLFAMALARTQAEAALARKLRLMVTISHISKRFIDLPSDEIEVGVRDMLALVGESLALDRASLGLISADRLTMRMSKRWSSDGDQSEVDKIFDIDSYPWIRDRLVTNSAIIVSRPDDIPREAKAARALLESNALQSAIMLPLFVGRVVIGILVFGRRSTGAWTDDDISASRLLAEIAASAIARMQADERRRHAFEELSQVKATIERERDYLREEVGSDVQIIGHSAEMGSVMERIRMVAPTHATVLIRGESGVGKELVARAIHRLSPRANAPLVKVNCAAVPHELFESEFFGHVRGAFTGAIRNRVGRFELADGGTLLLDEVGEIPLVLQSKLLRVLQEGELERIGDDRTKRINVRIIAATNRDLAADVAAGRFREDLYYRLSVFPLQVPPLRERRADIVPLAEHFLQLSARAAGRGPLTLDAEAKRMLSEYPWPGNIRELEHVIERAVILSPKGPLRIDLALAVAVPALPHRQEVFIEDELPRRPFVVVGSNDHAPPEPLTEEELRNLERDNLLAALSRAGGRIAGPGGAAEILKMRPSTLRDRIKSFGIARTA